MGGFIIIKKINPKTYEADTTHYSVDITIGNESRSSSYGSYRHHSAVSTNWLIFDLGFANWRDKTVYGSPEANSYLNAQGGPDFTSSDLNLNNGKSSNVNIWLFMQKLNVINEVVNLKYGLGLEMYNYRYETNISYHKTHLIFSATRWCSPK